MPLMSASANIVADSFVTERYFVATDLAGASSFGHIPKAHYAAGSVASGSATIAFNASAQYTVSSSPSANSSLTPRVNVGAVSDMFGESVFVSDGVASEIASESTFTASGVDCGVILTLQGGSTFRTDTVTALLAGSAVIVATGVIPPHTVYRETGRDGGVATLSTPVPHLLALVSGRDGGMATVLDNIAVLLSGSTSGGATVSEPNFFTYDFLSGSALGFATTADSAPMPIFGEGGGAAFLLVTTVCPPISSNPEPTLPDNWERSQLRLCGHTNLDIWERKEGWRLLSPGRGRDCGGGGNYPYGQGSYPYSGNCGGGNDEYHPHGGGCKCPDDGGNVQTNPCLTKQFRWGYMFTRGDLMLCLFDRSRNPISPYNVSYTMYQVRGQLIMQTGPFAKSPVMQKVGLYYATGTSGENGQPGNWLIRWSYQVTFQGAPTTVDFPFQVVDAVTKPIPGDPTCRVVKYGWD